MAKGKFRFNKKPIKATKRFTCTRLSKMNPLKDFNDKAREFRLKQEDENFVRELTGNAGSCGSLVEQSQIIENTRPEYVEKELSKLGISIESGNVW